MAIVAGVEALVILILLAALLVGQPAGHVANLERIQFQSEENAMLRATVQALPRPTAIVSRCPPTPNFC